MLIMRTFRTTLGTTKEWTPSLADSTTRIALTGRFAPNSFRSQERKDKDQGWTVGSLDHSFV